MEYKINNAEFTLLLLIMEVPNVNGYGLRSTVADRGMEAWAGVGSSSIYVVLKKLESRGLVVSNDDLKKQTKGPRGKVFTILPTGKAALLSAIEHALAESREHDNRFNIALSGMNFLGHQKTVKCFRKREEFLANEHMRLANAEKNQPGLPLSARLLFGRIRSGIKAERNWLNEAIEAISFEGKLNVDRS